MQTMETDQLSSTACHSDDDVKRALSAFGTRGIVLAPRLTKLVLSGNNIGDEGAKMLAEALKDNTTLTSLYLWGNNIGDEGAKMLAEALKDNTTLTSLDLRRNNIGVEGAKMLAEALMDNTTLTDLGLSDATCTQPLIERNRTLLPNFFGSLPSTKDIHGAMVSHLGRACSWDSTFLRDVKRDVCRELCRSLASGPSLVQRDIASFDFSAVLLHVACSFAELTELNLSGVGLAYVEALPALPSLTELNLSRNNISAIQCEAFAQLTALKTLDISHNQLQSVAASVFCCRLRALSRVSVGHNPWHPEQMDGWWTSLLLLPSIECIDMLGVGHLVQDGWNTYLLSEADNVRPSVRVTGLPGRRNPAAVCRAVVWQMSSTASHTEQNNNLDLLLGNAKQNPSHIETIRILNHSYAHSGNEKRELVKILHVPRYLLLTELDLSYCKLGSFTLGQLDPEGNSVRRHLRRLRLRGIGVADMHTFLDVKSRVDADEWVQTVQRGDTTTNNRELKCPKHLKQPNVDRRMQLLEELDLGENNIKKLAVEYAQDYLVLGGRLAKLVLDRNRIVDLDASYLTPFDKTLKALDLSRNGMESTDSLPLPLLETLNLSHNELTSVSGRMLSKCVQLRELDLSWNALASLPVDLFSPTNHAHLDVINLRGNCFEEIPTDTLERIDMIVKRVLLDFNFVTQLPARHIAVDVVSLYGNEIDTPPPNLAAVARSVVGLDWMRPAYSQWIEAMRRVARGEAMTEEQRKAWMSACVTLKELDDMQQEVHDICRRPGLFRPTKRHRRCCLLMGSAFLPRGCSTINVGTVTLSVENFFRTEITYAAVLDEVKTFDLPDVTKLVEDLVLKLKARRALGLPAGEALGSDIGHMMLMGPPGVGKTTLARLLGRLLFELGALETKKVVVATPTDMVAGYKGQTGPLVRSRFAEAKGGILFIDEAYGLTETGDEFGREAVREMLTQMLDNASDTLVIVAGYESKMLDFLAADEGLPSRFAPQYRCRLAHFSAEKMMHVFEEMLKRKRCKIDPGSRSIIAQKLTSPLCLGNSEFGNGRGLANLADVTYTERLRRAGHMPEADNTYTVNADDVKLEHAVGLKDLTPRQIEAWADVLRYLLRARGDEKPPATVDSCVPVLFKNRYVSMDKLRVLTHESLEKIFKLHLHADREWILSTPAVFDAAQKRDEHKGSPAYPSTVSDAAQKRDERKNGDQKCQVM